MNWWQNPYQPPPPWGGAPPGYLPIPPGTDPIKIMEFMDRVQRRAAKANEKKDPKKEEKKKEHWKDIIWYFQAACVLYFLSPYLAALQHIVSTLVK